YRGAIKREVALGTLDDCPIRHHARVAHPAGDRPHLKFALLTNHILEIGQRPVLGHLHSRRFIPFRVLDMRRLDHCVIEDRPIEYDLPCPAPVSRVVDLARVEQSLWLLLTEPFLISLGLSTQRVDRIALVYSSNWN